MRGSGHGKAARSSTVASRSGWRVICQSPPTSSRWMPQQSTRAVGERACVCGLGRLTIAPTERKSEPIHSNSRSSMPRHAADRLPGETEQLAQPRLASRPHPGQRRAADVQRDAVGRLMAHGQGEAFAAVHPPNALRICSQ